MNRLIGVLLCFVMVSGTSYAQTAADADFDGSGTVDFSDFLEFAGAFGSDKAKIDLDGNGEVGFGDFLIFAAFFGQTVPYNTIVVNNPANSGSGTLRRALSVAVPGDVITFDPTIFPPETSVTVSLILQLPSLIQGNLTIDASNAGVILDGSGITEPEFVHGLAIQSNRNIIQGLQIVGFSDAGIALSGGAKHNLIGGDRGIGTSPQGQGNLISGKNLGIGLFDQGTSDNTVQGNTIGLNLDVTETWGNAGDGIFLGGATNNLITGNIIGGNNNSGIHLCCVTEGGNTVTNNIIGTDTSGEIRLGNHFGVRIDHTGHNVIGPDNIIAFNERSGILMEVDAPYNSVIRNSIRDNGEQGIDVASDSGAELASPFIVEFDLQGGSLTGWACPNCIVEVFSDSADQGAIYEGQTLADSDGFFSFSKGVSFTGPHLTTNATVVCNRILTLDVDTQMGAGHPIDWSVSELYFPPEFDSFVDILVGNGVAVNYMLLYWDKAGHALGEELPTPRFKTEQEIQDFVEYARLVVRHFKGRIQYYTIWNEPDACGGDINNCIEPLDYQNLAEQIIPVIREEDPQAKVVSGPNVLFHAQDQLLTLLNSDVIQLFDVISWHPLYDIGPNSTEFHGNYYYDYPSIIQEIKDTASASGFQGEYWGSELTWNSVETCSPHPDCDPADIGGIQDTDIQVAKYYARGIVIQLGLDVGVGLGGSGTNPSSPVSYPTVRNMATVMAGTRPDSLVVDIESAAMNITSYGFSLPDGDKLFALWTDGVAIDDDPGVSATLTFPGLSPTEVTSIDVLDGYEQELIAETGNGSLVIRDLLVKDYPIFVRLTD